MNTFVGVSDAARLMNDLGVVVSTLSPEIDIQKLVVRLEEVLSNYDIQRRTQLEHEEDILEKMELFIDAKRLEGLSEVTLSGYRIELNLFANHIKKAVVQVTTADIRGYLAKNNHLQISTIDRKLNVLRSFFAWLVQEEMLLRNPTLKIKPPKQPKRLPKGLSVEELEIVRESCESLRERALVEVMYSTGCRLSEITNLKVADVNLQNMNARVIGKGNKERIVYLSFKALYHLKRYLISRNDDCEYLFVTYRKPYRKVSNRSIQDEINKIESRVEISKKLTPHTFRHTFATLAAEQGIEIADLQHLMGHEDPSTTLVYAHVTEERKQQAYKKYHVM